MSDEAAPLISPPRGGGVLEILFLLIVFFLIVVSAYFVTRFVAGRASGRFKSRHMEVVDTLGLGADAQLLLVKAGAEFFLVSKSQKHISLVTKLENAPELTEANAVPAQGFAGGFRAVLEGKLSRAGILKEKGPPREAGGRDSDATRRGEPDCGEKGAGENG